MMCAVIYDEDLACFNFAAADRERCICASIPDSEIAVIGNIHDTPELQILKEHSHEQL